MTAHMDRDALIALIDERIEAAHGRSATRERVSSLTYSIDEAAQRLGHIVTADWLKKHIGTIPHLKSGAGSGRAGRVAFTDAHLAEILSMLEQRPEAPATDPSDLEPVGRRRSS